MVMRSPIDTGFDVCEDARGKDPDAHSPILRRYHRLLGASPFLARLCSTLMTGCITYPSSVISG